jgi:hypothetical protein
MPRSAGPDHGLPSYQNAYLAAGITSVIVVGE